MLLIPGEKFTSLLFYLYIYILFLWVVLLPYPKCSHCSEPFQNLISVRTRKTLLIPRLRKANILFKVKGVFRLNFANGTKHNMNKSIKTSSVIDDKHLFALRQLAKTLAMGQGLAGLICGTAVKLFPIESIITTVWIKLNIWNSLIDIWKLNGCWNLKGIWNILMCESF